MDPFISICKEKVGGSPSGLALLVKDHLQSPQECGCFALLEGARDREGRLFPALYNYNLWCEVGHIPGTSQLQKKLLLYLCMGMDVDGNQLAQTELFRLPVVALLTFPSEVSMALDYDPQIAYRVVWETAMAYCREIDKSAVTVRIGGGESESRSAKTLSAVFLHARNKAGEPQLHAHVLTFPSALDGAGIWRTYSNRVFMRALHAKGGGRQQISEAMIASLGRCGYEADIHPGRSSPDKCHGARVTCPGGLVIHPGSVPRLRSAQVDAKMALWLALGTSLLTDRELSRVLQQVGQYPVAAAGGQRQDRFQKKLETLQLLDPEGRITQDLLSGLSALDVVMATVEASLRDLPIRESVMASQVVREHRDRLCAQVPEICTDEWLALHAWTTRYDDLLELVATGGYDWEAVAPEIKKIVYLLERAGVMQKQWMYGGQGYSLTTKGEARRALGLQEAAEIKAVVPELFAYVSDGQAPPEVILGRLQLAGVHVHGIQLQFRRLGRVVEAGEQIRAAGIESSTSIVPDFSWWQWYWDHRHDLPAILNKVVLHPEELPASWPEGSLNPQKTTRVDLPDVDPEPIHYETRSDGRRSRSLIPPLREHGGPDLTRSPGPHALPPHTSRPQAPEKGRDHGRKR